MPYRPGVDTIIIIMTDILRPNFRPQTVPRPDLSVPMGLAMNFVGLGLSKLRMVAEASGDDDLVRRTIEAARMLGITDE